MVQLRSCYFCGTAEAITEYETLPNALQTDERSQRVALCDRCQQKLTTIMMPVVEALEDGHSPTSTHAGDTRRSPGDPVVTRSTAASDESTEQAAVTFSDDADDVDDADERDDRATEEAVEDVDEIRDAAETDDADGSAVAAESAATAETDDAESAATAETDEPDDADETAAEPTDPGDAVEPEDRGGDELDVVYHKLLRFLRNREFPIPRTEAETVAQSAYDLSASDAATVIQRAVDRGVLEERDGELHRR